jgi:DNA-binding MarR family transcriptional regulator
VDVSQPVQLDDVIAATRFRAALRTLTSSSERKTRRHGITPAQYQLLLVIKGAPDRTEQLSVGKVAAALQVAQSTATELIARAEDRGLVSRSGSHVDGRRSIVRLTELGEDVFARCFVELGEERGALIEAMAELGATLNPEARGAQAP